MSASDKTATTTTKRKTEDDKVDDETTKRQKVNPQTNQDECKETSLWRFNGACPKILRWYEAGDGKCGICSQLINEREEHPCKSLVRNYSGHNFTTSNPPMTEARIFRPFCFDCWSKYHTHAIIVDGYRHYMFNHYSTLHVVCNWQNIENLKMERTSGKIDQKCKVVTQYFDDNEKQVSFINFNTCLGEPMIYLWTDDAGINKCQYLSDIQKLNPQLPAFQWRFPNRVPFHEILQWMRKPVFSKDEMEVDDLRSLHKLFYLVEWYNPNL